MIFTSTLNQFEKKIECYLLTTNQSRTATYLNANNKYNLNLALNLKKQNKKHYIYESPGSSFESRSWKIK